MIHDVVLYMYINVLCNSELDEDAKNLLKLEKLIEKSIENKNVDLKKPSFLAAITSGKSHIPEIVG